MTVFFLNYLVTLLGTDQSRDPSCFRAFGRYYKEDYTTAGVRVVGKFELKKGQKITAALGQQPFGKGGSGGSFLVLETDKEQKLLLVAGGAGYSKNKCFGEGSIKNVLSIGQVPKEFRKGLIGGKGNDWWDGEYIGCGIEGGFGGGSGEGRQLGFLSRSGIGMDFQRSRMRINFSKNWDCFCKNLGFGLGSR